MTMPPPTPVPSVSMIRFETSPPRAEAPLGERRGVAVVLDAGRKGVALARPVREVDVVEREVDRLEGDARAAVDVQRHAVADRSRTVSPEVRDDAVDRARAPPACPPVGVAISIVRPIVPSRATRPARIFVPPRSTPITRSSRTSRLR